MGKLHVLAISLCGVLLAGCSNPRPDTHAWQFPGHESLRIIDLGAIVTEDLPERFWGRDFLAQAGFTRQNSFEVVEWEYPLSRTVIHGSNGYYTLFNHGGPHIDAPNHVGEIGGVDSFDISAFCGPVKVFDVRQYPSGRSIPVEVFRGKVEAGDVVLVFTGYVPPESAGEQPEVITLTNEAAEFLANLAIRAYGTDSLSVENLDEMEELPWIHHVFLSRPIPVYEQLVNLDKLLGHQDMFFVGVPLNIKGGDGMMVRPVVFVPDKSSL